jgi:lipopolysaccharide transport system permease protein
VTGVSLERPSAPPPAAKLKRSNNPSLRDSRELLVNLTLREIRSKYKRTTLGHAWSLLNPLAIMAMYSLVFGLILKVKPDKGSPSGLKVYALFLMAGLIPWTFFNNAITAGMNSLINNANLLKKVYFRRDILVSSTVFSWLVTFAIEMAVLMVALLAFGGMPLPWLPLIVLMMVLLTMFAVGLALALSVLNVYFRDTEHFISIFFLLWFYLTPVLYPISRVENAAKGKSFPLMTFYRLNPMERFVQVFRDLLYDNGWPAWQDVTYAAGSAVIALGIGVLVFRHYEGQLAEEL